MTTKAVEEKAWSEQSSPRPSFPSTIQVKHPTTQYGAQLAHHPLSPFAGRTQRRPRLQQCVTWAQTFRWLYIHIRLTWARCLVPSSRCALDTVGQETVGGLGATDCGSAKGGRPAGHVAVEAYAAVDQAGMGTGDRTAGRSERRLPATSTRFVLLPLRQFHECCADPVEWTQSATTIRAIPAALESIWKACRSSKGSTLSCLRPIGRVKKDSTVGDRRGSSFPSCAELMALPLLPTDDSA